MDQPVRVLHVLAAMDMAGTETLLMNLYRNINRDKVQFDFAVSAEGKCAYDDEIESLGGRIFHYPRYRVSNHFKYRKWWEKFLDQHKEYKIIHGHIGSTAAIYLGIAKKMGLFSIAHSHGTREKLSVHSIVYGVYSYPTRFTADYFIGCSRKALTDRYGKKVGNDPHISMVLNNGIDARKFIYSEQMRSSVRSSYSVNGSKIVIGTVGRFTAAKNPQEIIRICSELKRREVEFEFWWFGKGELEEEIREGITKNGLQDRIKLLGTRSDIYNALQGMDIFLFPSLWEGLGISCIEAQASGLPTLCSDTVPSEARVTDNIRYLTLNDTKLWCDTIEETAENIRKPDYIRPDNYELIRKSGYDISAVADELSSMYLNWSESK